MVIVKFAPSVPTLESKTLHFPTATGWSVDDDTYLCITKPLVDKDDTPIPGVEEMLAMFHWARVEGVWIDGALSSESA